MDRYQITFDAFNKLAQLYQEKFMDLDLYHDTYDTFCALIPKPDASLLEIGCGPGNITRYLLFKRPGFTIEAIDAAPNMVALARENNPIAQFKVMDCREISSFSKRFDGVMCGFCLPYLSKEDVQKLVRDVALLLDNCGIFYLSTIEGNYQDSGFEMASNGQAKAFVYYHSADFLLQELETNQFTIVAQQHKYATKPDGTHSCHLILIAQKTL
ncbi:MAG: class I SAM-dependent DNA methyltransferase [Rufibacter sp.]